MVASKVREDDKGLFIRRAGHVFRPGDVVGYVHCCMMDDGLLLAGDVVETRHIRGTPILKVRLGPTTVRYWHNEDGR